MSDHLEKAKGALAAARDVLDRSDVDHTGKLPLRDLEDFAQKMAVAGAQASVAAAEALTRIAVALETVASQEVHT